MNSSIIKKISKEILDIYKMSFIPFNDKDKYTLKLFSEEYKRKRIDKNKFSEKIKKFLQDSRVQYNKENVLWLKKFIKDNSGEDWEFSKEDFVG